MSLTGVMGLHGSDSSVWPFASDGREKDSKTAGTCYFLREWRRWEWVRQLARGYRMRLRGKRRSFERLHGHLHVPNSVQV